MPALARSAARCDAGGRRTLHDEAGAVWSRQGPCTQAGEEVHGQGFASRAPPENGMKKMKLVMVGNGMAGVRTIEELLKIAPDLYDITVFGAEPHPNYNRILLSPVLAGEQQLDDIVLNPLAWYEAHGIALHLGRTVVHVAATSAHRARRRRHRGRVRPPAAGTGSTPVHPAAAGRAARRRRRLPRHRRHERHDRGGGDAPARRSSSAAACSAWKRRTG